MKQQKNFRFQLAGGSVPGTDHTKPGEPFWRNNNDAYAFYENDHVAIGVVADGCGSPIAPFSEVGAHIISQMLAQNLRNFQDGINALPCKTFEEEPEVFSYIRSCIISSLVMLGSEMGGDYRKPAREYFLSTLVGCIATRDKFTTFSVGDGIIAINGEVQKLGPFPNNEPPYLAYGITGSTFAKPESPLFHFSVATRPLSEIESACIGTDGVESIIGHEHTIIPGLDEPVGPLSQFWTENRFFKNPDAIRRRLAQMNHEQVITEVGSHPRIRKGLLHDDTTLVVLRKIPMVSP